MIVNSKEKLKDAKIILHKLEVTVREIHGLGKEIVRFMPMAKYIAHSPGALPTPDINLPVDISVNDLLTLLKIKLDQCK